MVRSSNAVLPNEDPRLTESLLQEEGDCFEEDAGSDAEAEQMMGGGTIVQFSAPIYYGDKRDGVISIDVVRHGCLEGRSSCKYATQDLSAIAGQAYKATFGEIVFESGEQIKSIEVPLVRTGVWAATLEFRLHLSEPQGCILGPYLRNGRVKVIDDCHFPSSKFGEALEQGKAASIPGFSLFLELFKWTFMQEGMGWKTALCMFMDQLRNIYMVIIIRADMYFVNVVCNTSSATELLLMPTRDQTVYLLAAIHILPFALLHLWDWAKVHMDILGNVTVKLQQCMFRKYLNLSAESREAVPPEILHIAVMQEAGVVASGYVRALALLVTAGNIAINFTFIMLKTPSGLVYGLAIPALVLVWALFRNHCFIVRLPRAETASLSNCTTEACQEQDLIASFHIRPQMNAAFSKRADALRITVKNKRAFDLSTTFVLQWLSPIAVGAYMVLHTGEVVLGELSLGAFLATAALIKKIAADSALFFGTCQQIISTFPALRNMGTMLNKETDLLSWKKVMQQRHGTTTALLEKMDGSGGKNGASRSDDLPITCAKMMMTVGGDYRVLENVNLDIAQGKIIMVNGPHGSGKSILLHLLAHQHFPTGGEIFVPSHLRTLLVPSEARFLERSLLENLTLGNPHFTAKDLPRLKGILGDLSMHKAIDVLDQEAAGAKDLDVDKWLKTLTGSDKHLLSLARAFMMNPEVIMFQRPLGHYQSERRALIRKLILEHKENRGLRMPAETVRSRRPRTVFFTADADDLTKDSDITISMQPVAGLGASTAWTAVKEER